VGGRRWQTGRLLHTHDWEGQYFEFCNKALSKSAVATKLKAAQGRLLGCAGKSRPGDCTKACLTVQGVAFAKGLAATCKAKGALTNDVSVSTGAKERIGKYPEAFQAQATGDYQRTKKDQQGKYDVKRKREELEAAAEATVKAPVKKLKKEKPEEYVSISSFLSIPCFACVVCESSVTFNKRDPRRYTSPTQQESMLSCLPACCAAAIINGAGPLQTFKSLWERDD
jgi:hypothetical protein